jgi:hypothetical protein
MRSNGRNRQDLSSHWLSISVAAGRKGSYWDLTGRLHDVHQTPHALFAAGTLRGKATANPRTMIDTAIPISANGGSIPATPQDTGDPHDARQAQRQ